MIPAIRKKLLIHSVLYKAVKDNSRVDDSQDNLGYQEIENVLIQPTRRLITSKDNQSIQANATMYWDSIHSTPITFKEGATVNFNGREMTIVSISEFYDDVNLHHIEVGLL